MIILVLAALSLPMLGQARQKVPATKCVSNLRQMGVGMFSYLADNDQNF